MLSMVAAALITGLLVLVILLSWGADVRRVGRATSAREANPRAAEARARRAEARLRAEEAQTTRPRPAPPPPAVPAPPSDDARHRATLELPPGPVTAAVLRRQYRALVAAYHPDRVAGLGAKLQRLADDETKAINEAYAWFKTRTTDDG